MGYRCKKSKAEILNIIVTYFDEVNTDIIDTERNWGRYIAMMELLQRLEIMEEEERV